MLTTTTTAQLKAAIVEAKRAAADILTITTDSAAYQKALLNLSACISLCVGDGLLSEKAFLAVEAEQQHAEMKVRESILDTRHRHFDYHAHHHLQHRAAEEISSGSRAVHCAAMLFPLCYAYPGGVVAISRFYFF